MRAIEVALEEGRDWNLDHRIVRPDGEVRMIHARGEVEFDAEGRAVAVHGTCQDVTEQRSVEDALRNAEQLFRRAFDDAPIGMALIDLEGRWLRLNRAIAQMFGRTESEMRASSLERSTIPRTSSSTGRSCASCSPAGAAATRSRSASSTPTAACCTCSRTSR